MSSTPQNRCLEDEPVAMTVRMPSGMRACL